jgi:hypothetical protein
MTQQNSEQPESFHLGSSIGTAESLAAAGMTLAEMFAQCDDDYLDFNAWADAPSKRADLAAFILLDKLQPGGGDIVSASEHDEFFLSIDCDELAKVATLEDVRNLRRCGVMFSESDDCLSMYS